MDERWKWLQLRINSSLRPKPDDLNKIFSDEGNCLATRSFFNNEDVRKLFVYIEVGRKIVVSTDPPREFHRKSVFFYRAKPGIKLTAENLDGEVLSVDCGRNVLENLGQLTRDVYLPLLCTNVGSADTFGVGADKLMDALHRLLASVETTQKSDQGEVILALPSVEVLAEVAANKGRKVAVLHVLETTVVGWSKQIEKILKHDPIAVLHSEYGEHPGPLDEIELWMLRRAKLSSILRQLKSPVAVNIFQSLKNANSSYVASFQKIVDDVNKAKEETEENLVFLETMNSLFDRLHVCTDPKKMAKIFPPLVHTLYLLWMQSKYYHQSDKFHNLLGLISNAIIRCAEGIIGDDILSNPAKSYVQIRDTVRACACFRGVYLDYLEKTNEINKRNMEELAVIQAQMPKGQFGLLSVKMYGPYAYKPQQGTRWKHRDEIKEEKEDKLKTHSLWPPRNGREFDRLTAYMERCNDALELVQTIEHFQLLATTAEIGGAGTMNLDVLVREIYQKYSQTMDEFLSRVPNVLTINENDGFAEAFFVFRSVIKDLEKKMADVLRQGFLQCPTTSDRLRLLEVFEGISGRHHIQVLLRDEYRTLVQSFTEEVRQMQKMFTGHREAPPTHRNMPAIVSRLLWVHALKLRIELPMNKMQRVSAHLLESDLGRQLLRLYSDVKVDMDRYQSKSISDWQNGIPSDLTDRLNQPLLTSTDVITEENQPMLNVSVQLDPKLMLLLREIYYLSRDPFFIELPLAAKVLVESIDFNQIRTTLTRLETIVSKYNTVMRIVTPYELELFNRTLSKIWQLFTLGTTDFTWCTEETADFLELANSLVCVELYENLDVVQTNCRAIIQATEAWSKQRLDVFSESDNGFMYNINELKRMQEQINKNFESTIIPAGNQIRKLLSESFKAVEISEASPAWQEYVSYVDTVVLSGLKSSCLLSLRSMLKRIDAKDEPNHPLLVIRTELIQGQVVFSPPLDPDTITESLPETIENWLNSFVARGRLITDIAGNTSFHDYIETDEEVQHLLSQIQIIIKKQMEDCKQILSEFERFSILWKIHIHEEFQKFLKGDCVDSTPSRTPSLFSPSEAELSRSTSAARASSTRSGQLSQVQLGHCEREFLSLPPANTPAECRPTLDDFEAMLDRYKDAHDAILNIPDEKDVDWIRIDTRPIKLVSTAYAKLIMFAYTQYLSEQVTKMLDGLDRFLEMIEPEIESITGDERDTASFMRIMRTFHTVSAKQQDMEGKFVVLDRAVDILIIYEHRLPERIQAIYDSMSGRWTNLKTKVGQAKQKIGPRIREESASISKDLILFGERLKKLYTELKTSEVHRHTCTVDSASSLIDSFTKRLDVLENEAQDLMELQEFLETSLVDFGLLRKCHQELSHLRQVWQKVRLISERQSEWKHKRWTKVKVGLLRQDMEHQHQKIQNLPTETLGWDVTARLEESISLLITYASVIEYLNCPSMRPRHWKHLMTVTGGVINTDSELLKTMTLGELMQLRLDKHLEEVRLTAERAGLDITIERCLKKYEEIWLSKVFDLQEHVRSKAIMISDKTGSNQTAAISDTMSETSCTSGVVKRSNSNMSSYNRMRRTSVLSLPNWLMVIGDNVGPIYLISNMDAILEELESHQVSLQTLQADSGIGTFMDDVSIWQKTLQTVEVILHLWVEAQEKWIELEEIYSSHEMSSYLPTEFGIFNQVNQDFKKLMVTVKDNNNVLQCCQRESIKSVLESLNSSVEKCWQSLLRHLEFRRQKFPRYYFLSTEDILHIMCNGYDVSKANRYIHKLFENIGMLVFEKLETAEKSVFQITAVESHLRESLKLLEPVVCEGGVEKWLARLLLAIKSALKAQLMTAFDSQADKQPVTVTKELDKENSELPEDGGVPSEQKQEATDDIEGHLKSEEASKSLVHGQIEVVHHETVLSQVTEIALLATRLAITSCVEMALQRFQDGDKDALKVAVEDSNKSLESIVNLLTDAKKRSGMENQSSEDQQGSVFPPYQMGKLASMVVLACYERDLFGRLHEDRTKSVTEMDFHWRSQLQYRFQQDGASVEIQCSTRTFDYGFEYMGSTEQAPILREMERPVFYLASALHDYSSCLLVGTQMNDVRQLSQALGRPFFQFHCTKSTDYATLCNAMKGLSSAGAWVCFTRLNQLRLDILSCFGELLRSVITALQTRQSSVGVLGEELSLDPNGSCLATLDRCVRLDRNDPQWMSRVPATAYHLPRDILDSFRVSSHVAPSIQQTADVLLLTRGFSEAAMLSRKISALFKSGQQLLDDYSSLTTKDSGITVTGNVWNLYSLRCLVHQASVILDRQRDRCGDSAMDVKLQDRAIVMALKDVIMPRLPEISSLIFASLLQGLWLDVDLLSLGFVEGKSSGNLPTVAISSGKTRRSGVSHDCTDVNSPLVTFDPKQCLPDQMLSVEPNASDDHITGGARKLGLVTTAEFHSDVTRLQNLTNAHQTVMLTGPVGCGKTSCVRTLTAALRSEGLTVHVESIFLKALELDELFGHYDRQNSCWSDGLLPCKVRELTAKAEDDCILFIHLDGNTDAAQSELLQSVLRADEDVVFQNGERINLGGRVRFIWETEDLSELSPSIISNVGVVCMEHSSDVWKRMVASWLMRHEEDQRKNLRQLCDRYLPPAFEFMRESMENVSQNSSALRHVVWQWDGNVVSTLTALLEALVKQNTSMTEHHLELCFNFSCVWAFGALLDPESRETFSGWWRKTFNEFVQFPRDGTVFDYTVSSETAEFVPWSSVATSSNDIQLNGNSSNVFVHTAWNERLLQLVDLLSRVALHPVMLFGDMGTGKTSLVEEHLRTRFREESIEDSVLRLHGSRFTNARLVYERLMEKMDWKHGTTFLPKGNGKLLCIIDDVHLCQMDKFQNQSALELVRQHIDRGGFHGYAADHKWHNVPNVAYILTANHRFSSRSSKPPSRRLARHFAMIACHQPGAEELETIYRSIMFKHFTIPMLKKPGFEPQRASHNISSMLPEEQVLLKEHYSEQQEALHGLLSLLIRVTIEVHDKARSMYLPTAERSHYIFNPRDLSVIFKNLTLSLHPGCKHESLLLLWEHECYWTYGRRMVSDIDFGRFRQTLTRAIEKNFANQDHIRLLVEQEKQLFSNLVEHSSGLVTAGSIMGYASEGLTEEDLKTDLYRPVTSVAKVRGLLLRAVDEYNKANPPITITLYKSVIEQVCRLARVIASPHSLAHTMLVAEGCAGRMTPIVNLAAHLCGFQVFKTTPAPVSSTRQEKLASFKTDIMAAYTLAGVQRRKLLIVLEEEDLLDDDFLVYLTEFIMSGFISHLFSFEDQTTIINSIRTEVTQAGLAYTRDVAWKYFLNTVKNNLRVCFVASGGGTTFQQRCRDYINFSKSVNIIWFPHWTKRQLLACATHHLRSLGWFNRVEAENVAHLLATMHLVIRQQDKKKQTSGHYKHLVNLTYEKLVERFVSLANARHREIHSLHEDMIKMNNKLIVENALASKLRKDLEHEKIVLEERKTGTNNLLSQIGQDATIAEQQMKLVRAQMDRIKQLRTRLPEYQVARERAVYKTVAIVADTKKVVKTIKLNHDSEGDGDACGCLQCLRTKQKPPKDIEDLLGAVIMILKNPQADRTWQKGAKRQMANLERFIEELISFDENSLPESTLQLVEDYLQKMSFEPEISKSSACVSLCNWVRGVARYHRTMFSKVKPLHDRVTMTMKDIEGAEQKMKTLEVKRKALENRLADLGKAFEEATVDKMDQLAKTIEMEKSLQMAAELKQMLTKEQRRIRHIIASLSAREACLTGSVAIAAAFATYLGPYQYRFRHEMLTIHWPACLRERGIPLVIDSIDQIRGHVIEWSMEEGIATGSESTEADLAEEENLLEETEDAFLPLPEPLPVAEEGQNEGQIEGRAFGMSNYDDEDEEEAEEEEEMKVDVAEAGSERSEKEDDYFTESSQTEIPYVTPAITTSQYRKYVQSVIKILVGETRLLDWMNKGFSSIEMENTAILFTSWQRVPLLIDAMENGLACYRNIIDQLNPKTSTMLDLTARMPETELVEEMEGCIIQGRPLMLSNCTNHIDSFLMPLVEHFNSRSRDFAPDQAPKLVTFRKRRMLCHPDFRLFLATSSYNPKFSPTVASLTSPINYGMSNETVFDNLLQRAFAILRPELSLESRKIQKSLRINTKALSEIKSEFGRKLLHAASEKKQFLGEVSLEEMSQFLHCTQVISSSIKQSKELVRELESIREELFPLARRAAELFCILRSLAVIYREYHFTYDFFVDLFDEALGGKPLQKLIDSFQDEEQQFTTDESELNSEMKDQRISPTKTKDKEELSVIEESDTLNGSMADVDSEVPRKEHPIYRVPHLPKLPSEGVQYAGMAASQIRQLVHRLTMLVLHRVKRSLYGEHRVLFGLLVSLTVYEGQLISEEEIAILIYGNMVFDQKLELVDGNSVEQMPEWLPSDKWQNLLFASLLPGPLNGLCQKIAENGAKWKTWYQSRCPEQEALPIEVQQQHEDEVPRTDLQRLIILRLLRPDRLSVAVSSFVSEALQTDPDELPDEGLDQVLSVCRHGRHSILVLLPPGGATSHALSNIEITQNVADSVEQLAKVHEVALETVAMGEASEERIVSLLRSALTDGDRWILVTNVHLASTDHCKQLQYHLQLLASNEDSNPPGNRCIVWLTAEPSSHLPVELLEYIYPLAWDSVQLMALTMGRSSVPTDGAGLLTEKMDNLLSSAIISGLQSVPVDIWTSVSDLPPHLKSLTFCLGVVNGLLVTRQLLGSRGLVQYYPLEGGKYLRLAIEALIDLSGSRQDSTDDQIKFFAKKIVQDIYGNVIVNEHDQEYLHNVLDSACLAAFTSSDLRIGSLVLPIPPNDNVDAMEFSAWLDVKLESLHISEALSMPADINRELNESTSSKFLQLLERAYTAQGFDLIDTNSTDHEHLSMLRLRLILDHLKKELPPPLMDLPTVKSSRSKGRDFIRQDMDRPGLSTTSDPWHDTIGLVLLKECLGYNDLLHWINRDLVVLRGCLLGGKEFIPDNLRNVAYSLYKERVPLSWVHTNHKPVLHSLTSWKDGLIRHHRQLESLMKHRLVTEAGAERSSGIRKFLSREGVWFGGFVNPQALLTALRHEKSVTLSCPVDEIELTCEILSSSSVNSASSAKEGDGFIVIRDLFLQGAMLDSSNNCLVLSQRQDLHVVPRLLIRAIRGTDAKESDGYRCPVFMNRSRQLCVCHLPLKSSVPSTRLITSGTALVLDQGLQPNDAQRNPIFGPPTNSHLKLRSRSYYGDDRTYRGEARAIEIRRENYEETVDRSLPSTHSQLSYKPFSPNAPSLPPGLLPLREPPLGIETRRVSVEKNEHPAILDANGSTPRPQEEHSVDGREMFGKAQKEREEETVDDKEDLLQILQMAAGEEKSKKKTMSLAEKDDVTFAETEYAALAEYSEIELPMGGTSQVIQMPERKAVPSTPDTTGREIRGVLSKDEGDVADDDDDEESNEDDEDDDDEDDSFHA